ncbi:hypothetical protein GCM10010218_54890 [Streptomyces mashuensis]|uniref:Uncharacterized protein n=1 Tax=Streptomyces mashuensis TaxID=33904 RepID=A0A919B862_9ACTN|nr:hypothetical protein [Streptomyces mashuensis]GHF66363.1 hypothetical protein GCM10010218_54890 [Streptomyces mashuensis]
MSAPPTARTAPRHHREVPPPATALTRGATARRGPLPAGGPATPDDLHHLLTLVTLAEGQPTP